MHRNGFRGDGLFLPDSFIDLLGGKYLSRVSHEELQNREFLGCQMYRVPVDKHFLRRRIQFQPAIGENRGGRFTAFQFQDLFVAPKSCLDPGHEFDGRKGFGEIVVRADGESMELVHVFAFGGEKQDGNVRGFADAGDHGESVHFRHHDVHHGQSGFAGPEGFQSLKTVFGLDDVKASMREIYGDGFADAFVVFNNQDFVIHALLPPRYGAAAGRQRSRGRRRKSVLSVYKTSS